MTDQGFSVQRQLVDQPQRLASRPVPFNQRKLTSTETTFATVPQQQLMRITRLAVCNPTASAGTITLYVTPPGGTKLAQLYEHSVSSKTAVDLTALVGGLYVSGTVLSVLGTADLVVSGQYEAVL